MRVAPADERIVTRYIEDEMKESYLTYAMSVNTNRAIPDVRDGLKPSTRRILYAMGESGLVHNRPHDKCAAVVGEVMKNYHPHGDGPIYETLVGMAQDFAMRCPLIDGQGNFGCFTGDTEIKLLDGTEKSFEELAKLEPDEVFYVYSVDENGRVVIGEGLNARVTRRNARLIELTLDNGETIRCTPDHKFMLRDGTYRAAEHLTEDDSLMPGYLADLGFGNSEFGIKKTNPKSEIRNPKSRADVYDITVDKYHNFLLTSGVFVHNSIDDDPPGAMRYTEARLTEIAREMLVDIGKNTVDFQPNYKESTTEPKVLPAKLPNLLINGTTGIGVGYLTKIPPHNLGEIVDGAILLLENPDVSIDELIDIIPGPDFPTAGLIVGRDGIRDAYTIGKGSITIRARSVIERQKNGRERVIISEIPYQVKKNALLDRMYNLVENKTITGITDIRDESDKQIRIVVELRRGEISQVILNRLFKHTQMQVTYGAIMLCLVNGLPKVLNLKEMLWHYLEHRKEAIRRRTQFDLEQCRRREHMLEGYRIVLDKIDDVIQLIKGSESSAAAREQLMSTFNLSKEQTTAILDMALRQLTTLAQKDINEEYNNLQKRIASLEEILKNPARIQQIIKEELLELKTKYGDDRRTEIIDEIGDFHIEDLIADENMVITITHERYIKRIPVSTYQRQRRGGIGVRGMQMKSGDFVEHVFVASNHQYILFFTDRGKCYWLKVFEIPEAGRTSRGRPVVNMLRIEPDENITAFIPIREFDEEHYLFMATRKGIVKKCDLQQFSRPLSSGIIAINLKEDDKLIGVKLTDGSRDIFLVTRGGKSIRFKEDEVRSMGRTATGVKGIRLSKDDWVVEMDVAREEASILTVTENGYGKRTDISEHTLQKRGGKGLIAIKTTGRNGSVVGVKMVADGDELIVISSNGMVTRIALTDIKVISRNTQGVTIMALQPDEQVVDIARIAAIDDSESEELTELDESEN
ncbi:MAG: DNA gyrase subunit A [Deltaproteobacteria bacterium]|nr:DNA gyrase subunit A [Deltaproteobacteria bacterium]